MGIDRGGLLELFKAKEFCKGLRTLAITFKKLYKVTWTVEEIYYHMMGELLLAQLNSPDNLIGYLYKIAFNNTLKYIKGEKDGERILETYLELFQTDSSVNTNFTPNFTNLLKVICILDNINTPDMRQFALINLCGIPPKKLGLDCHQLESLNRRIRRRLIKMNKLDLIRKLLGESKEPDQV